MLLIASDAVHLYKFPLGRCLFALRGVQARAVETNQTEVATLAGRGAELAQTAMDMTLRFQASYGSKYPPAALALDTIVDRCLGGVSGYLDVQIRMYPEEPRGEAAERLLRALFPDGVAAVTSLPFAEEHGQVNVILDRAQASDLAADVEALPELPSLLARLRERNDEYGAVLRQQQDGPSRDELRAVYRQCQDRLAETMALIIGLYALRSPDNIEERDHLLEPIVQQNQALRAIRRRRRVPIDVDPSTGEEIDDPEPGPGPGLDGEGDLQDDA